MKRFIDDALGPILVIILILGVLLGCFYAVPKYNVWRSHLAIEKAANYGKAEIAEAEQNKKVLIEEAKANLEAQKLNSQAEVERAKGMAEAIEIENGKLTDLYIKYLWVRQGDMNKANKVIYIPTEANLPILEAKGK